MNLNNYKNIYMSGIGGISMSGLAEILVAWGFMVSGSDSTKSKMTEHLESKGIKVFTPQVGENISNDVDLFVYSAAIKEDNAERVKVKELGIPSIERGAFLGEITKLYKNCIGISGTHGKTTTTSMTSCIFLASKSDPTIQVGSLLKQIGGNFRVGKSDILIIEACEYCDSYLNFQQKYAVVTNIDNDHLDYFGNLDNIKNSFRKYVSLLPSDGALVVNRDDENAMSIINACTAKVVTFGINNESDYTAKNISYDELGCGQYELYQQGVLLGTIKLNVPGVHNIYNSLGAAALALENNINIESVIEGLSNYEGVARRLEYKGTFNGAKVYDDYGHHPTEIKVTANAVKQRKFNKSYVIFEPHTFSRTFAHLHEFAETISLFDNIILLDIYAAREVNEYGITEEDVVSEIKKYNTNAIHISDYNEIKKYLVSKVADDDIIITIGAGYVTKVAELLVENS